ncbi:MAG: bifunctional diaminohydroxyphosphoribosylaminopyrimidine deaminase/5-amino-6-(5-phosphoribosylamino)uracil reductase RibD [Proteobacteria bacterium]|nr:bifunctional diaminohydroxyphosphoribosylaminopyrimidine deaminase/5-amino-6-(5-phosphoribosylamino)uracil reductase RibD [Pseudomonadota bacterium]
MFSEFDNTAMQRALALAAQGIGGTDPNPRVGCVIAQGNRIVGEGWHERAGQPHAEALALRNAGARAAGATVYVTLEPCAHHGRTPPCADALIAARVARVVYCVADPNPQVAGAGAQRLRAARIAVETGLLEAEARELNAGFFRRMGSGRPLVRVKLATSLDGRTALADGTSRWITGEAARADVHRWRARSGAILTGIGTVLADDPRLTVRPPSGPPGSAGDMAQPAFAVARPLIVVLDASLRLPLQARLFDAGAEVLVMTAAGAAREQQAAALTGRGARVELLPADTAGVALPALLDRLGELEINEVLVEAGPTLAGALLQQGLVDELLLYVAPKVLGQSARPLLMWPELTQLPQAAQFEVIDVVRLGPDLRLRLRPRAAAPAADLQAAAAHVAT